MAVRNDYGLKNLPIITTLGMLYGSSLNILSCSIRFSKLVNQEARPLFDGYARLTHGTGTLFKAKKSMIYSICSEIVSIPLNP